MNISSCIIRIDRGIYYGNTCYDAISYWFSDPDKRPEAIICANDYMAMTVCNALEERGIYVGRINKCSEMYQESGREYKVYVSFGWCIIKPDENTSIEDCLIVSDSKCINRNIKRQKFVFRIAMCLLLIRPQPR